MNNTLLITLSLAATLAGIAGFAWYIRRELRKGIVYCWACKELGHRQAGCRKKVKW